jgi:hypothetical protein
VTLLRPEEEARVREWFAELERPVELFVAVGPEETPLAGARDVDFGAEMVRVCEGLAELGDRVTCRVEQEPDGFLVGAIVEAGRGETSLRPESVAALEELDRDLTVDVFVTPT